MDGEAGEADSTLGDCAGSDNRSELGRILGDLLNSTDLAHHELDSELEKLERQHQHRVYSELIYLLSHLRFPLDEAHRHWRNISRHRHSLEQLMGARVDSRVALVHYFLGVERKLRNPKIVEMSLFEKTQDSVYRDELTGLHNYRFFSEQLTREIARSRRSGSPLSLLMADIDDFKQLNDVHGHQTGNTALSQVAHLLTQSIRKEDVVARYGGEEFTLILPATPKTAARTVAERVRSNVERCSAIDGAGGLTISIGIATCPADAVETEVLIRQADRGLYAAKTGGKNRVELYGSSTRSHRRVAFVMAGRCRTITGEHHDVTTVEMSEGGMLLRAARDLPIGSLVEVDFVLPESLREVRIPGRVVYVNQKECGTYEAAISTADIATPDRHQLARHLRN